MGVPTHVAGCRTRLFPTRCPDCGLPVFYFDCTCGSKVFFDQPGEPWPEHRDRCLPYLVRQLRDKEHLSYAEVRRRVEDHARSRSLLVPSGFWRTLKVLENRELGGETILEVRPNDTEEVFAGTLTSVNLQVNILRRYGAPDNQISRGLYAAFLSEPLAEVSVRGARDNETGFVSQFTFFLPSKFFKRLGLRVGAKVGCVLSGEQLPNHEWVWMGTDLYGLR
jgi:hypothetical protein